MTVMMIAYIIITTCFKDKELSTVANSLTSLFCPQSAQDLQTEADRAAQRSIITSLQKYFPKSTIIGECDERGIRVMVLVVVVLGRLVVVVLGRLVVVVLGGLVVVVLGRLVVVVLGGLVVVVLGRLVVVVLGRLVVVVVGGLVVVVLERLVVVLVLC